MRRHNPRAGFTLIEMVVASLAAIAVATIAIMAISSAMRSGRTVTSDIERNASSADATETVRQDVERAGERLFAAYNLSGINAVPVGVDGAELDTLVTLSARGRAVLNSTQACTVLGPSDCVVLQGDATSELSEGDLLMVGSPQVGAKLVQVASVQGPFVRPCGADCGEEAMSLGRTDGGQIAESIVVSHTITWPDGRITTEVGGCPAQGVTALWTSCVENTENRTIGVGSTYDATVGGGTNATYTEVSFADRTSQFAYPAADTWTPRSGSYGVPSVYSQMVRFGRTYVDRRNIEQPMLVRVSTMETDGTWGPIEPISVGVSRFRVETQHRGETAAVRGTGLAASDFVRDGGNPNYVSTAQASAGTSTQAYSFSQNYSTIAGVRIEMDVQDARATVNDPGQSRDPQTRAVVVATPHLLDGGVIDTRVADYGYRSSVLADSLSFNAAPVAWMRVTPNPAVVGASVSFDDNGSNDTDGAIVDYSWEFGDGSPAIGGVGVTSTTHAYAAPGTYTARLTVTDDAGAEGSHAVAVVVTSANDPPVPSMTVPGAPATNVWLTFVSTSTDPDGTVAQHNWTFSDGQSKSGVTVNVMFANAGDVTATLTAVDNLGASASISQTVSIGSGNTPPVASISPPACQATFCLPGGIYTWDASTSYDTDGTVEQFRWDFSDGTGFVTTESANHSFMSGGVYNVTLSVTDEMGASGAAVLAVVVNHAPSVALAAPPCADTELGCFVGVSYTFSQAGTSDLDDAVSSYGYDAGDGSAPVSGTMNSVLHTYSTPGTYTFTATATDSRGSVGSATKQVKVVENTLPVVNCPGNYSFNMLSGGSLACTIHNPNGASKTYSFVALSSDTLVAVGSAPGSMAVAAGATLPVAVALTAGLEEGSTSITLRANDGNVQGEGTSVVSTAGTYGVTITATSSNSQGFSLWAPGGATGFGIGSSQVSSLGTGITVYVINKATLSVEASVLYQTGSSAGDSDALAAFLSSLGGGKIVLLASNGAWQGSLTASLGNALYAWGAGQVQYGNTGDSYSLMIDSDSPARTLETVNESVRGVLSGSVLYGSSMVPLGGLGSFAVRVTNTSSVAGKVSLSASCGGGVADCEVFSMTGRSISETQTLSAGAHQDVLVTYRGASAGAGTVQINGSFGVANASFSQSVNVGETSIRPPPSVTPIGDFSAPRSSAGQRSVTLTNGWTQARTFNITAASSSTNALGVSAGSAINIAAGESRSVSLSYSVPGSALAGATSTYGLSFSDGVSAAVGTNGTFTVSATASAPIVISPPNRVVQPGETGTLNFGVVNPGNSDENYTVVVGASGVADASGAAGVFVAALDTAAYVVNYTVDASPMAGQGADITVNVTSANGAGSGLVRLAVDTVDVNPGITAPALAIVTPGSTNTGYWIVRNNSNAPRTLALSVATSGNAQGGSVAGSVSLGANTETTVPVTATMRGLALRDSTGVVTLTASFGAYSGNASQTLRAGSVVGSPVVTASGDITASPGARGSKAFSVQNNNNYSTSFAASVGRTGIVGASSTASSLVVGGYGTSTATVNYSIDAAAAAGATGTITYTVSDGPRSGAATVNVTVATTVGVSIGDVLGLSFDPQGNTPISFVVSNTGNSDVTVAFQDVGPAGDGNASLYHARLAPPSNVTIPATSSRTVTAQATILSAALGDVPVTGSLRVYVVGSPTVEDAATVGGTTGAALANPTVTPPAAFSSNPAGSGNLVFLVTSNSNATRTYSIATSYTGDYASASAASSSVSIGAFGNANIGVAYTAKAQSVAGTTSSLTLLAADGIYSGSGSVVMTTNLVEVSPAVCSPAGDNLDPGASTTKAVCVTNNTNTSRSLSFVATSSATAVVADPADPATTSFAAYETKNVGVSYSVSSAAVAGQTSTIALTATDQTNGALSGSGTFLLTVNLKEIAPLVVAPADTTGKPGEGATRPYSVTNRTNQARTLSFVGSSGNGAVVSDPADPANLAFAPYQTRSVSLTYSAYTQAIAGTTTDVTLTATDTGNPTLFGADAFTFTTELVELSPTIAAVGNHAANPGASTSHSVSITNRTNQARTLNVRGTYAPASSVFQSVTEAGSENDAYTQAFAPYASANVIIADILKNQVVAGEADVVTIRATDASNGALNATSTHTVTANLVNCAPIVANTFSADNANPGQTKSQTVVVTNCTNAARTLTHVGTSSNTDAFSDPADPASLAYAAYGNQSVTLSYAPPSNAIAGTSSTLTLTASDGVTSLSGSSSFSATVNLVNVAPGVTAPGNVNRNPGYSGSASYSVYNGSNHSGSRNFTYSATSSATSVVPDPADPAAQSFTAFQTQARTVSYGVSSTALAGQTATVTLVATDATSALSGSAGFVVTTNLVDAAPTVTGPGNVSRAAGYSGTASFTVTANSNNTGSRTFSYAAASSNTAVVPTPSNPASQSFTAFQSQARTVSYSVSATAMAGASATVTLTATDATSALSGSGSFVVTALLNNVAPSVTPPANQSRSSGYSGSASFSVYNGSNHAGARTFTYTATSSNTAVVPDPADPASQSFTAFQTQARTVSYSVAGSALAGQTSTVTLNATDATSALSGSGAFVVTVSLNNVAPSVTPPANVSRNPGYSGSASFSVYNGSNHTGSRTFTYTATSSNAAVVPDPADPASQAFTAFQTQARTVSYSVGSSALAGSTSTVTLNATDATSALSGSGAFVVTVNLVNAAPTVVGPGAQAQSPGYSGSVNFTVTSNSNHAGGRTFSYAASSSNTAVVPTPSNPASQSFTAFQSQTRSLAYAVSAGAEAGSTSTVGLTATDGASGLSGTASYVLTVTSVLANPTVTSPGNVTRAPGYSGSAAFNVRNNSNSTRTFSFSATSSNAAVVPDPADPSNLAITYNSNPVISVSYGVAAGRTFGETSTVTLTATDVGAPAYSGSSTFVVTVDAVLANPTVTAPGNVLRTPGYSGSANFNVVNNTNSSRSFAFTASSSNTAVVPDPVDPSDAIIAYGGNESVTVSYSVSSGRTYFETSTLTLTATDVGAPAYSGSAAFIVTVDVVLANPTVTPPANTTEASPYSGSGTFFVRNNSNMTRNFNFTATSSNTAVVPDPADPAGLAIAYNDNPGVVVSYSVASGRSAGETATVTLIATDAANLTYSGSAAFVVTVASSLANPTVTAPSNTTQASPYSGSATFYVQNNSNATRTFSFSATSNNTAMVADPADPSNLAIGSGNNPAVTVSYSVASGRSAGETATITLTATDTGAPAYSGSAAFVVTVASSLANPTVTAPSNTTQASPYSGSATFYVQNNSNAARTFSFSATSNNTAMVADPVDPSNLAIGAGANPAVAVSYSVASGRSAGETATITLTATDTGAPAYSGSAAFVVTVAVSNANPSVVAPGNVSRGAGSFAAGYSVTNNSNASQTLSFVLSSSNTGVVSDPADPSSVLFSAWQTQTVNANYTVVGSGSSVITLQASYGAYSGSGGFTVTATVGSYAAPSVSCATANWSIYVNNSGTMGCTVTNNNVGYSESFTLSAQYLGDITYAVPTVASTSTLAPGGSDSPGLIYYSGSNPGFGTATLIATGIGGSGSFQINLDVLAEEDYMSGEGLSSVLEVMGTMERPGMSCSNTEILEGQDVSCYGFHASGLVDSFLFEWGDGSIDQIAAAERVEQGHTFEEAGEYVVSTYVMAADGRTSASRSTAIRVVANSAPDMPRIDVDCGGPCVAGMDAVLRLSARDPDFDAWGDYIQGYHLAVGEQAAWIDGDAAEVVVRWPAAGREEIVAVAYDRAGLGSAQGMISLEVRDEMAPVVACEITRTPDREGLFTVTLSFEGDSPITGAAIQIGDREPIHAALPGMAFGSVNLIGYAEKGMLTDVLCSAESASGLTGQDRARIYAPKGP